MMIFAAPLQGYTDAPYRHFHASLYASAPDAYFSPFIRMEHGTPRPRDIRDITSDFNTNHRLIPQIIFRSADEFKILSNSIKDAGYTEINLNLGCPFSPQVKKGRGAGMLTNTDEFNRIADIIRSETSLSYSIKMRLGVNATDDWKQLAKTINSIPLQHVTLHPRTASQQYDGELHMECVAEFIEAIHHPIIFNGNIFTPEQIDRILSMFPAIAGIMIGRGLLMRPSIIEEWRTNQIFDRAQRLSRIMELHHDIFAHYTSVLCGDSQILSKIKPFWEYLHNEIGHKSAKAIKKAMSIRAYETAINTIN